MAKITGTSGPDILTAQSGQKTMIVGLGGDDFLTGSNRTGDTLLGGDGNDHLWGGKGKDLLTGGSGADTFVFKSTDGSYDQITDFEHGVDTIEVHGYGPAPSLKIAWNGSIYVNGDLIAIDEHHHATAADFVFLP